LAEPRPIVYCQDCGARLDESPTLPPDDRSPCPNCGSRARRFEVTLKDQADAADTLDVVRREKRNRERKYFWVQLVIGIVATFIVAILALATTLSTDNNLTPSGAVLALIGTLAGAITTLAGVATTVSLRRKRDQRETDRALGQERLRQVGVDAILVEQRLLEDLVNRGELAPEDRPTTPPAAMPDASNKAVADDPVNGHE